MKLVLVFLGTFLLGATLGKEITCYIASWHTNIPSRVDTGLCTYYLLAFGEIHADGNITPPSNIYSFLGLKTPNSKLLLALGGGSAGIYAWRQVASTPTARSNFALNCLLLCRQYGLDGVDIDWEFPDPEDRDIFTALHRDIYELFNDFGLRVSTALSATNWLVNTNNIYDVPELSRWVHGLNLMTYDYHMDATWDIETGVNFNSPRTADEGDSIARGIQLWLERGAPSWKIFVGIPFYSRTYVLQNPGQTEVGSPFVVGQQESDPNRNVLGYSTMCHRLNDIEWSKRWDVMAASPFMHTWNDWTSYEDTDSVAEKARLAYGYELAGAMIWEIGQDDIDGNCGTRQPLLRAIHAAISE